MARFLTTKGISAELEELIKKSNKFLLMSSFNIKISPSYINRLKSTSDRGVKIRILYGISIDPETLKSLRSIENAEVAQLNNLHAKLFINENRHHY